jgi:ADP-L-glycero-D-manno-heptose 6-epimerase
VAASLFQAVGRPLNIEYIPMPDKLKEKYQYYTRADIKKLRSAGCSHTCMSLDAAVKEYVRDYLNSNKHLYVTG